jgi:hypothetical protein
MAALSMPRWQPSSPDTLEIHHFPEGVAVFSPKSKSTAYLPDLTGAVFDILLDEPMGLAEADILQRLTMATPGSDNNVDAASAEELREVLVVLEQQHLICVSE